MYYVYSTATCPISYSVYVKNASTDLGVIQKRPNGKPLTVVINGGHGVANKFFVTPRGAVTQVSDEDMEILLQDKNFKRHMDAGFMSYEQKLVETEKKADEMAEKDRSAPITPEDYIESDSIDEDVKVYKKKKGGK